ncbi:ras association domain-containing protein 10 [Triplophysa rosa]|uniref:Ras association domain-containing protein 10 n=1 Tax=Triplophysa rosa TaxID=992332 RepID=A0A9W7X1L7_TRIRA|nr:ras association domain-containing protein 10 [Triplophysa rosa]KAI7812088.1 putative ras association domain-containing protein 10 [Triplophysa rosa]
MMEPEEGKISVWVCREEKLVSGLSRRTTCADVVRVLMDDQNFQKGENAAMLTGTPQSYCIVEKWRGYERILPNKTKILRLWIAWGDEQENVRFVLVKNEASLPNNGPRSAEARVVLSKESPCTHKGAARPTMAISQDKQRRIVRKAFRKLDKINKKKEETLIRDSSSAEKMETLVHLIISQDHTIRQQIQRIKELDNEIEMCESKVHFDRMKRHGVNYVQDTYMQDQGAETESTGHPDAPCAFARAVEQFEEYASRCDEVIKLQEELTEQEALMDILSSEIQEELNHRWMRRRREELSDKDAEDVAEEMALRVTSVPGETISVFQEPLLDKELQLDEERIKTQLDTSLYIGLRLNTDMESSKNDLEFSQELLDAKERELRELLEKVHRLDELEGKESKNSKDGSTEPESEQVPPVDKDENIWVEQARGLSKTCRANDDDSDTGLSSMHSQDSDNAAVCESLV